MKRSEFIEKWLEALESGKYKQTRNQLRSPKIRGRIGYCCLGVACDVANKLELRKYDFLEKSDGFVLPDALSDIIGICESGSFKYPVLHRGKEYHSLADMNDRGVKFKTIARIIREQIENKNFEKPR